MWKNEQELKSDISIVRNAFESWKPPTSDNFDPNEFFSAEDKAFEELRKLYGVEQATIKLNTILAQCFTSAVEAESI